MPAEIRSFYDPLEPFIYWDSSFSIAATDVNHNYYRICRAFVDRCMQEDVICFVSDWVLNEVAFYLIRTRLELLGRQRGLYWRELLRRDPSVIDGIMPLIRNAFAELSNFALWLPSLNEQFYDLLSQWQLPPEHAIQLAASAAWSANVTLSDEAMQLVERYRLLPTDAAHIVVALSHVVRAFATLDPDFALVDGIILFMP
ncbi:MAG: PIN domain-containing protein [Candidatus Fervidibacter sacchari]